MPQNTSRGYTYPLYGDTQNFPAQIQDLAQDIDADVQTLDTEIDTALHAASASVSGSINAAVAPNVTTTVQWNSEDWDNSGFVNLGVNNTRIRITQTGAYIITGYARLDENGVTVAAVDVTIVSTGPIAVNPIGVGVPAPTAASVPAGNADTGVSFATLHYVPGPLPEDITMTVRHNQAGAALITAAAMSVSRIAP